MLRDRERRDLEHHSERHWPLIRSWLSLQAAHDRDIPPKRYGYRIPPDVGAVEPLYGVHSYWRRELAPSPTCHHRLEDHPMSYPMSAAPLKLAPDCDVCGGDGTYPIHDMRGSQRYSIRCPECYGTGRADPDNPTIAQGSSQAAPDPDQACLPLD